MGIKKQFATDKNLETDGITIDYGDFSIRIARAGGSNQRYNKVLERKSKPFQRSIANDSLDPNTAERILRETYAESVILGWSGVTYDDVTPEGEDLPEDKAGSDEAPFTKENVIAVFENFPDLYSDIQSQATKMSLFRKEVLEENAKNS